MPSLDLTPWAFTQLLAQALWLQGATDTNESIRTSRGRQLVRSFVWTLGHSKRLWEGAFNSFLNRLHTLCLILPTKAKSFYSPPGRLLDRAYLSQMVQAGGLSICGSPLGPRSHATLGPSGWPPAANGPVGEVGTFSVGREGPEHWQLPGRSLWRVKYINALVTPRCWYYDLQPQKHRFFTKNNTVEMT